MARRLNYEIEVYGRVIGEVEKIRGKHGSPGIRFTLLTSTKAYVITGFGYAARNDIVPFYDSLRVLLTSRTPELEGKNQIMKRFWYTNGAKTYEDLIESAHGSLKNYEKAKHEKRFNTRYFQAGNVVYDFGDNDFVFD